MNDQLYGAKLSPEVESALAACGRDRVFHSTNGLVAIHWEEPTRPAKAEWLTAKPETPGEGHDACGRKAALEFAKRLREVATALVAQAESIERPLRGGTQRETTMSDEEPIGTTPWRVGRKVGRTLYDKNDRLCGVVDTPDIASLVVDAVNGFWGNDVEPPIIGPSELTEASAQVATLTSERDELRAMLDCDRAILKGRTEEMTTAHAERDAARRERDEARRDAEKFRSYLELANNTSERRGAERDLLKAALKAISGCECDLLAGGAECQTLLCRTCIARHALAAPAVAERGEP